MRNALLSVYDKRGISEFAKKLALLNFRIIASPGTAKELAKNGISVCKTTDFGSSCILGHRVVTLHPVFHAGLLAREDQKQELISQGFFWIDLVCVDLYPLKNEIEKPGATRDLVLEMTDIGGPGLLRSAAKGRRIVIAEAEDRENVIKWLESGEPDKENFLNGLGAKAEFIVSKYAAESACYHSKKNYDFISGEKISSCGYGENGWQIPAGLYSSDSNDPLALQKFKKVKGADLSYNNFCDLDRLLQTITHIAAGWQINFGKVPKIAVAVKHGNACGAGVGDDAGVVLQKMIDGDRQAIFGGMVMANFPINEAEATELANYNSPQKRLLDAVFAPSFSDDAIKILKRAKGKCRFLANAALENLSYNSLDMAPRFRYVRGGFLRQPNYSFVLDLKDSAILKSGQASPRDEEDMVLAWAVGCTSNSNTTAIVRDGQLLGNGVAQQDRVGSCELGLTRLKKAGHNPAGAIAYTDSFFPFADGPETLFRAGIKAVFASSGSIRDKEVFEAFQKNGVIFYAIPDALGRGFFGH
ncbi:MAG: hypothetical protein WC459_01620 [Patescibacteria group bacterium]